MLRLVSYRILSVLGAILSIGAGVFAAFERTVSSEGVLTIYALLVTTLIVGTAYSAQSVNHRRPMRYAKAAAPLLRAAIKARTALPDACTPEESKAITKSVLTDIASAYRSLTEKECYASVEVLTARHGAQLTNGRRVGEYDVHTLCRDEWGHEVEDGVLVRQSIEGSSAFTALCEDTKANSYYMSGDVENESGFLCKFRKRVLDGQRGRPTTGPRSALYHSTLIVKICDPAGDGKHGYFPIGFLWLRSPAKNLFFDDDPEIVIQLARALAPAVARGALRFRRLEPGEERLQAHAAPG